MNYIGIIQVKYQSDLFPGKSLSDLGKETVLEYLIKRLKEVSLLSDLLIATTTEQCDDKIVKIGSRLNVKVWRGDSRNVLGRIYSACKSYNPYGVVKILGNAPLIDIDEMGKLVIEHYNGRYDYAYNEHESGVVYGMGCGVFSFNVLETLVQSNELTFEQREIGSLYIRQHPEKFKILKQQCEFIRPSYRALVDHPKDVDLVKTVIRLVPTITNKNVGEFLDENPLLIDYQKGSELSETGLEKMFLFPEKIKQLQNGRMDQTYPVSVELSLTNICNFKCDWCSDGDLRERLGGELTLEKLQKIFIDLHKGGTRGLVIEGGGEPMLHPQFNEIVRSAAETGLAIGLITNGSVKIKKEIIDIFEWIRISLDAATPEQHSNWKKVDMFEKVMNNIRFIGEYKNKTTLGIGYVVTKHNVSNLENLLLRLRLYNVDYIQLRPVIDHPELSSKVDLSHLKKFEMPNFKVDIQAMRANIETGNSGKPCIAHSLSSVITADGGVYLCGRLNIYEWVKPVGNLHESSFKGIWLGDERKKQMSEVADPDFCRNHCPECRMTKYNLLLDRAKNIKTRSFI